MQTSAAKGALAGAVAVTASAVAPGSGVVLGRAAVVATVGAAAAAAAAGVAEALGEFILCLMNYCLDPDLKGDSSEVLVINSCQLTLWTVVVISAWRTHARCLPSAYIDALKAQVEAHMHPPPPPVLSSFADPSEGRYEVAEVAAKRQALEAASIEEGLVETKNGLAKQMIRIKRDLILIGTMAGGLVGAVVVDVLMLAAMASAAGARAAGSKAVGWAVAVATVGAAGAAAGARAAELFDFPFQNLLIMDEEEQVRATAPSPYSLPRRAHHYLYRHRLHPTL